VLCSKPVAAAALVDELRHQGVVIEPDLATEAHVEVLVGDVLDMRAVQRLEAGVGAVEPDPLEVAVDQDSGTDSVRAAAAAASASTGAPASASGASASIASSQ